MSFTLLKSVGFVVVWALAGQAALAQSYGSSSYGGGGYGSSSYSSSSYGGSSYGGSSYSGGGYNCGGLGTQFGCLGAIPPIQEAPVSAPILNVSQQSLIWKASTQVNGMLTVNGADVTQLAGGQLTTEGYPVGGIRKLSMTLPLTSAQNGQGEVTQVTADGGLMFHTLDNVTEDGVKTTTGGSLSLTNWTVDAINHRVLVDVVGDNGVGAKSGVNFFTLGDGSVSSGQTTFASFGLTVDGTQLFGDALGLNAFGRSALKNAVPNFGTLTVTLPMPVPEPSSWVLMLFGALGVFYARTRAPAPLRA